MASWFTSYGSGLEVSGKSIIGDLETVINSDINNPQPTYKNQIPEIFFDQIPKIFFDQIGNRFSGGNAIAWKWTLPDFPAAQQQHSFHHQAAINAFLVRSMKPRTFHNLQLPTIGKREVETIEWIRKKVINFTGINLLIYRWKSATIKIWRDVLNKTCDEWVGDVNDNINVLSESDRQP